MKSRPISFAQSTYQSSPLPGLTLYAYKTDTKGVLTIFGSFLGGDTFGTRDKSILPDIVAGLLDTGTKNRSKEALRDAIESLGANLTIGARGNRVIFTIQAMPEDAHAVLQILSEELKDATFPDAELGLLKHQIVSSVNEERSDTFRVAMGTFLRAIYPTGHANYEETIESRLKALKKIKRADVVKFYKEHYGRNSLYIGVAGSFDASVLERAVVKNSKSLLHKNSKIPVRPQVPRSTGKAILATVKDKMAVDVVLGHELPIRRSDKSYYPFLLLIELLGASGFTSHLFQTVRERDGLTYVIRAGLAGFGDADQGHWFVRSMFAPHLFKKGLATIQSEIEIFLKSKLTDEAIEKKKVELVGSFEVSLGTTSGIARMLLWTQEEGLPISFIDTYPDILRSITPSQVREAAKLLEPSRITISAAGSIDKNGKPL